MTSTRMIGRTLSVTMFTHEKRDPTTVRSRTAVLRRGLPDGRFGHKLMEREPPPNPRAIEGRGAGRRLGVRCCHVGLWRSGGEELDASFGDESSEGEALVEEVVVEGGGGLVEREGGESGWDLGIVVSGGNVSLEGLGALFAPAEKKEAGKKTAAPSGEKKKRTKTRKETYSSYIYKVLKQVHPDTGISNKAMLILNSFVNDIFERIGECSPFVTQQRQADLAIHPHSRRGLQARFVQQEVDHLLPRDPDLCPPHPPLSGPRAGRRQRQRRAHRFLRHPC